MTGAVFGFYERLEIGGMMPERALLRLRRAGIPLYNVEKPQKDCLRLSVKKGDVEKVFAIYPKACYNENGYTPYTVRSLGRTGLGRYVDFAKKRIGFIVGACLFCIATLFADSFVFGVEFSASSVYQRETYAVLEEYGLKPFSRYKKGNEDLICSKLLSLDGVEFCSIRKSGMRIVVDMRLNSDPILRLEKGDMQAKHTGVILSLTAIKGTAQKRVGDSVQIGETLVGAWTESAEGERRKTEVIARASVACAYECVVETADEKEAFATAYMQAQITQDDRLSNVCVTATEHGYFVKIEYTAIERINF